MRVLARRQLNESVALDAPDASDTGWHRTGRRAAPAILLTGPRGCGKRALCTALAEAAFPQPSSVLRLNMAHYAGVDAAAQLLGPPPGMVGHREGGVLTQQLRKRRRFLLIAEALSRAHTSAVDVLINVVRDAAIEAGAVSLDCRHVTVLATVESPQATAAHAQSGGTGQTPAPQSGSTMSALQALAPFWDANIALAGVSASAATQIAQQHCSDLMKRLHRWRSCRVDVGEDVVAWVLQRSICAHTASATTPPGTAVMTDASSTHLAGNDGGGLYDGHAIAKAMSDVEERTLDVAMQSSTGSTIHVDVAEGAIRVWSPESS